MNLRLAATLLTAMTAAECAQPAAAWLDPDKTEPAGQAPPMIAVLVNGLRDVWWNASADGEPLLLLRKNADLIRGRTTIRLAAGYEDGFHVHHRALHDFLNELNIEHEHEIAPGLAHRIVKWYQTLGARSFAYYGKALATRK